MLSLKRKHLTDSSNEKYCMLCLLSRALPMSHLLSFAHGAKEKSFGRNPGIFSAFGSTN